MNTYVITATVGTVALKTLSDGTWHGSTEIPPFQVTAGSKRDAENLAKEIIDPLDMAPVATLTALEVPAIPEPDARQLSTELDNAVKALDGDDAEHEALFGLATVVASVLGFRLDDLLRGGEDTP